jgi:tetratricopeptide (TPR) repeat protein
MTCRRGAVPGLVLVFTVLAMALSATWAPASQPFVEGLEAANNGKLDVAIEKWTSAIAHNPKSYAAYVNRGTAHMQNGHVFRAIMDWHKALEFSPVFAYGVYFRLFIPEVPRNASMLNYAKSTELDPDHLASVIMTGALLADLGRTDQLADMFRKCIDLTRNPLLKNYLEYWVDSIASESRKARRKGNRSPGQEQSP